MNFDEIEEQVRKETIEQVKKKCHLIYFEKKLKRTESVSPGMLGHLHVAKQQRQLYLLLVFIHL